MKLIFLLLVTYLGYFILKSIARKSRAGKSSGQGHSQARTHSYKAPPTGMPGQSARAQGRVSDRPVHSDPGEEMVLDPVCSSYVPLSAALKKGAGESVVYFCSEECRDKYQA